MIADNWDAMAVKLENEELEAQGGIAAPQVYASLLAIYLYQNDLCSAKALWKRIPSNIKAQNSELGNIWAVGKAMWQRDAVQIYNALLNAQWSDNVANIMKALNDKVRERHIRLIGKSYCSISGEGMGTLLGMNTTESIALAKERGWDVKGQSVIIPKHVNPPPQTVTSTEHQLHTLTSFVSFLEN